MKNKKVLVMGLGTLGGGIAVTKWLVRHGAKVTVTDLKTKNELKSSIKALGSLAKRINFILGKHRDIDFKTNEIVIVNPAVPRESPYLKIAKKSGARLENEASLFFKLCKNPIIAVTGTRGKTTTVNWIYHLLKRKFKNTVLTGNSSENPMLNVSDKLDGKSPVVVELSSWHLEILSKAGRAPRIAVITNIYPDHLNRYKSIRDYALAKANIFKNQSRKDYLVLNKLNLWTDFFVKLHKKWGIKSKIFYFPFKPAVNKKAFIRKYGSHNWENFTAASLVALKAGLSASVIKKSANSLPEIKFREQIIYDKKNLKIINDTTATSPDATIAALKRFAGKNLILIAGGTDKKLEFGDWAKAVKKYVVPQKLFLLNGSATRKIIKELGRVNYFRKSKPQLFEDLKSIVLKIREELRTRNYKPTTILFSPGAASFEKFKNEFDRGEKFNLYCKKFLTKTPA